MPDDNLHKVSQINIIFENRIIILIMFDYSIYGIQIT